MAESDTTLLKTNDLTKRFGGLVAIDSLDLDIKEQSIHSVIGPNGAGKTTIFNCITNFYPIEGARFGLRGTGSTACSPTGWPRRASAGLTRISACSRT